MSEKRKVRGSIDRLLEVVKVADQAHEGGHESVPGTGDPRHEAVLPELCIARGGRQQGRRDPRARRDSPAFGERGRSKGVKWRRERVVEQFVHDAQGRHSAPVPQRLQLPSVCPRMRAALTWIRSRRARAVAGAPSHSGQQYSNWECTKDL